MGKLSWTGISAVREKLAKAAAGLEQAASGAVVALAVAKVAAQAQKVAERALGAHVFTGAAQGTLVVATTGSLVTLSDNGYLRYHGWWPFRRGMPTSIVANAARIFEAELVAAIEGKPSPLVLAEEAAEATAAAKRAKAEARATKHAERERKAIERDRERVARGRARAEREGRTEARRGRSSE